MHNHLIMIVSVILFLSSSAISQTDRPTGWERSVEAGFMMSQGQYSSNWTGDEIGSVVWTLNSLMTARKWLTPELRSRNTLKLSIGQTHNQDPDSREWKEPAKSTDLIDLETLLRRPLGIKIDPFVALRFESQFLDKRDPDKTRSLNPLKFTESIGLAKTLMEDKNRELSTRIGFAMHEYYDSWAPIDTSTGSKTITDGGLELVVDYASPFAADNIMLTTKLVLFKAIINSESDKFKDDYWKELDLTWENIFTAKVNKYLNVNLYMQLIYDKEVTLGGRFKQTLALGLTYKLL